MGQLLEGKGAFPPHLESFQATSGHQGNGSHLQIRSSSMSPLSRHRRAHLTEWLAPKCRESKSSRCIDYFPHRLLVVLRLNYRVKSSSSSFSFSSPSVFSFFLKSMPISNVGGMEGILHTSFRPASHFRSSVVYILCPLHTPGCSPHPTLWEGCELFLSFQLPCGSREPFLFGLSLSKPI